jgi:hypothetical protein
MFIIVGIQGRYRQFSLLCVIGAYVGIYRRFPVFFGISPVFVGTSVPVLFPSIYREESEIEGDREERIA